MKVTPELIERLELLARIELNGGERERLTAQLDRIVAFVEKLRAVETSGVDALCSLDHLDPEHLREDEPEPGLDHDAVLRQAPEAVDGYFRVPRVIDPGE